MKSRAGILSFWITATNSARFERLSNHYLNGVIENRDAFFPVLVKVFLTFPVQLWTVIFNSLITATDSAPVWDGFPIIVWMER